MDQINGMMLHIIQWKQLQIFSPRKPMMHIVLLPSVRFAFSIFSSPSDILKRLFLYLLARSCRKSPRLRHGIRKPRPSSVELSTDLKDVSEGEDVFYTYRASVSSSKDSEGESSLHQLVSVATNSMFLNCPSWAALSRSSCLSG